MGMKGMTRILVRVGDLEIKMGSGEPCLSRPSGGSHRCGMGFVEGGKGTP